MAYLFEMMMHVHIRDKFLYGEGSLHSHAMALETELHTHEVNFQGLRVIEEEKAIEIFCNDPEERQHIIHLALKD
jgi:hypothetical protein